MAIFVKKSVDPTTARSGERTILAGNAVAQRLKRLVYSYVSEEVSGRSYPISGHRGSGKTTLIKKIVHDVDRFFAEQRIPLRPLLVTLQGPMLLPPTAGRSATAAPEETRTFLEQ